MLKSGLPNGPWTNEPDRIEFRYLNYDCLMVRGPLHHWCGYVAVPEGHPEHGKGYDDVNVEVHGGLTYANACKGHVCHKQEEGKHDKVWWLGFDCAHFQDLSPGMLKYTPNSTGIYRDVDFVQKEIRSLAQQLQERA